MTKTLKAKNFSQTFFKVLTKKQHKLNNEWFEMVAKMVKVGKTVTSPDNSYPTLTRINETTWSYEA